MKRKIKVLVLGAGFGGLELSSVLSERMGERLDLTLIDKKEFFYFGFSKLDLIFGRRSVKSLKIPYAKMMKPGVKFYQETITEIDPENRKVKTLEGIHHADVLVVALGADYNLDATPGLVKAGNEFYSFEGAVQIAEKLPAFKKGHVVIGVCSFPFKCPPAPSEMALLLHEYLTMRGIREKCQISLVVPFEFPIPPSYGTSKALLKSFDEKNIRYIPEMMIESLDPVNQLAVCDDGRELPFDLFLGIPEHCVPKVVAESGMIFDDWIPVDRNLKTRFPHVYAIGDVSSVGAPKAGIFAEGAARTAAESIIAALDGYEHPQAYDGKASCYVEFGEGMVGRTDVDFFSNPYPTGVHFEASLALAAEKKSYETSRKKRWFGQGNLF